MGILVGKAITNSRCAILGLDLVSKVKTRGEVRF